MGATRIGGLGTAGRLRAASATRPAGATPARWFASGAETTAFAGFVVGRLSVAGPLLRETAAPAAERRAENFLLFLLCAADTRYRCDGDELRAAAGDILCFDLAQADEIEFEPAAVTALAILRSLVRLAPTALDACHNTLIDGTAPLGQLFAGQLALLAGSGPTLSIADGDALSETIGTLAATLLAASRPLASAQVLDLPVAAILAFIERNLARTDLSPTLICRQFGLSRSALYRLFEPIGGIAACIRNRRLECARRHLMAAGEGRGSVARLALSVGFPSDSAFARAFRTRYGVVPSEALSRGVACRDFVNTGRWRRNWLENSATNDGGLTPRPDPGAA